MCLGIPGQVVGMLDGYGDQLALVNVAGENRKVNIGMLPEETFSAGDWVIIHMGFVVEKTDKAGADAAMAGLEMMGRGRRSRAWIPRRFHDRSAQEARLRPRRRPGRGIPAVRLHRRGRARPFRIGAQRQLRRDHRSRGRRGRPCRVPDAAGATAAATGGHRNHRGSGHPARRWHRLRDRRHVPVGRWPHAGLPRRRDVRATVRPNYAIRPTGAFGTRSSTARTAVPASRSSPHSPTTAPPPRWRASRCAPTAPRDYADPGDRRFHAQPVCCPNCGPALRFRDHHGNAADAEDGLRRARRLLRDGGVLAVKGIGGYHLACDAGNEAAVAELRRRKQRGDKPFAVMVPDLRGARDVAEVDDASARVLAGPQRPIVLLARRPGAPVADVGRTTQSRPRRDAGLRAAARTAVRAARRRARSADPGDDVGQPRWRADLFHRRRRT